jgi:hypothetical protein
VTRPTSVAVVDISTPHGTISKTLVLYQTHASHTEPQVELPHHANQNALMDQPGKNTNASHHQLFTQELLTPSRPKSTTTVQLKVPSPYTVTS